MRAAGYLEVETPVRIVAPAPEAHIEAPPSDGAFLRASPELHMKRLLAAGLERIYQIGPCFRRGERGARHNPEFTMLEWYRTGTDYRGLLEECRRWLPRVVGNVLGQTAFHYGGIRVDTGGEWDLVPVREAFRALAGWDPLAGWDAARFDRDMALKVEPGLPRDRPVVLIDYPPQAASLARLASGAFPPVAERWELYLAGMELCNTFSELTDPVEQRRRFREAARRRAEDGGAEYPPDEDFFTALDHLPPCAGGAFGVDRLVMLLCGAASIDEVRAFCAPIGSSKACS